MRKIREGIDRELFLLLDSLINRTSAILTTGRLVRENPKNTDVFVAHPHRLCDKRVAGVSPIHPTLYS